MVRYFKIPAAIAAAILTVFGIYALVPIFGEPPRLEQEYKLSLSGTLSGEAKMKLYDLVASELPKRDWANAAFVTGSYYIGSGLDVSHFEDTYFDTAAGDLERSGISHRLRYRWNSVEDADTYVQNGILPQRVELQTKYYGTGAIADGDGYKKALKNRYEIKNDYRLNPLTSALLRRQNGEAFMLWLGFPPFGNKFSPVTFVMSAAHDAGLEGVRYSNLVPAVEIMTKRTRFHVNKKTPFGYGDNPDNVFLVTIDESVAYVPGTKRTVGTFSEIEIDFERNTFFKLFDSVYKAGNDDNAAVLKTFESDQGILKSLIAEELALMGFPPEPGSVFSKYSKASDALRKAK